MNPAREVTALDKLDSACKRLSAAAVRLQAGESTAIREADQALAEVRRITVELQVTASADPGHSPMVFGGRLPAYSELAEAQLSSERRSKVALCATAVQLIEMMQQRTSTHSRIVAQLAAWAKEGRDMRDELEALSATLAAFDSQITLCRFDAVDRLEKEKAG